MLYVFFSGWEKKALKINPNQGNTDEMLSVALDRGADPLPHSDNGLRLLWLEEKALKVNPYQGNT